MRKCWALFVQFENSPLAALTNGWVYQGMFNDEPTLARSIDAIQVDIGRTAGMKGMRTVNYKVVELP